MSDVRNIFPAFLYDLRLETWFSVLRNFDLHFTYAWFYSLWLVTVSLIIVARTPRFFISQALLHLNFHHFFDGSAEEVFQRFLNICTDWMEYSESKALIISLLPSVITTLCGGVFAMAITWLLCLFYHCAYFLGIYRMTCTESTLQGNTRRNWFSCRRISRNTILLSTRGALWSEKLLAVFISITPFHRLWMPF